MDEVPRRPLGPSTARRAISGCSGCKRLPRRQAAGDWTSPSLTTTRALPRGHVDGEQRVLAQVVAQPRRRTSRRPTSRSPRASGPRLRSGPALRRRATAAGRCGSGPTRSPVSPSPDRPGSSRRAKTKAGMSHASFARSNRRAELEASIGTRYRSKFVDQGSPRPASRAVKTTSLPSGVKVNSVGAAEGLGGRVGVHVRHHVDRLALARRRHHEQVAAATVAPGVPVPHEDAGRKFGRWLFVSRLLRASAWCLRRRAGKTSMVKRQVPAVGREHELFASSGRLVTCSASPPSTAIRHTCDVPERVERKKTVVPSGDQRGSLSPAGAVVNRRSPLPSVCTSHRLVFPLFASRSVVRRVNTTRVPSGDTRGSEIRCMASMSWTENGCGWRQRRAAHRARATLSGKGLFMASSHEFSGTMQDARHAFGWSPRTAHSTRRSDRLRIIEQPAAINTLAVCSSGRMALHSKAIASIGLAEGPS